MEPPVTPSEQKGLVSWKHRPPPHQQLKTSVSHQILGGFFFLQLTRKRLNAPSRSTLRPPPLLRPLFFPFIVFSFLFLFFLMTFSAPPGVE